MGFSPHQTKLIMFKHIYKGKKVFLTGHTGFKGSWLAYWLLELGAEVAGYSLAPNTQPNHWDLLNLPIQTVVGDIREGEKLQKAMQNFQPDVVFHLAAQPLVRESYLLPVETFETNVIGTAKVYEAVRSCKRPPVLVSITTDKVYQNNEWVWGYRENDRLGGHDPYSTSKACVELLHESYRKSFFDKENIRTATARAGNVIGGGDWSKDRLLPDVVKATANQQAVQIRNPQATRPWQHVLEPLSAYLLLGQHLLEGNPKATESWNFASDFEGCVPVQTILDLMQTHWAKVQWTDVSANEKLHEANLLQLDSTKAKTVLQWKPIWNIAQTVAVTTNWYRAYYEYGEVNTPKDLKNYVAEAEKQKLCWVA